MDSDLGMAFSKIEGGKAELVNRHVPELEDLASSPDGQKVKAMLEKSDISATIERGDTTAMQNALAEILMTAEGKRLCNRLNDLIK